MPKRAYCQCMPPTTSPYEVNGYAVRTIRHLLGIDAKDLADAAEVDQNYIRRIETGVRSRVSPKVFNGICRALALKDRRAILVNPHGSVEEGAA
jgi:predicted transcriptional regulator